MDFAEQYKIRKQIVRGYLSTTRLEFAATGSWDMVDVQLDRNDNPYLWFGDTEQLPIGYTILETILDMSHIVELKTLDRTPIAD